ncbi:MAG: DnaJ domain-containing protein [Thermoleophilia bacterium]
MPPFDPYAVLGVEPDAPAERIREAWRFQMLAFHPDRHPDESQRQYAEVMAKRANAAWETLSDPTSRARYDLARGADTPGETAAGLMRQLPCPSCAVMFVVGDQGGRRVSVQCPACGHGFDAVVGAVLVGRPTLRQRFLVGNHTLHLLAADGSVASVVARRLPAELALSDGETVSVVVGPRGARYVVVHGGITDLGWRVG